MDLGIELQQVYKKKVTDRAGKELGLIDSIFIDPQTLCIESIEVKKGFLSSNYILGKDFIGALDNEGASLNVVLFGEFLGKEVFDSVGRKIGRVKNIKQMNQANEIFSLIVSPGTAIPDIVIEEEKISRLGKNIVLRVPLEKL